MATSLQRLLVLTIGVYLILVIAGMLYHQANVLTVEGKFDSSSQTQKEFSKSFYEQYKAGTPDVNTVQLDQTAGDSKFGGRTWIEVFLNPALGTMDAPPEADWLEIRLTNMVNWIIHVIQIIIALEVFLILYSKKTS